MYKLNIIYILVLLSFFGCSTKNELLLNNTYPQDIVAAFDYRGDKDSIGIKGNTQVKFFSKAVKSSGNTDDLELRNIIVRDTNNKLHSYRFSNTYLSNKNWFITIPFQSVDTIPPHSISAVKYFQLGRSNDLFHIAQEYYNSEQYEKCYYLLSWFAKSGGLELNTQVLKNTIYKTDIYRERTKINGYVMLMYLSLKKMNRTEGLDQLFETIKKSSPDYSKYLQNNDAEFIKWIVA